jgi:YD repeat-containing protein
MSFEYDVNGNETARTYSGVGRFEQGYNAAGRRVVERLPSGLTYNYEHDARGHIAKESDNRGRSVRAERDASGALIGLAAPDGSWVRATRDEAGRIVKLSASNGKSRHLAYDARGALTDYTNARGKHSKLKYDRRGRLQNITDDNGVSYKYNYDRNGQLVSVKRTGKADGLVARFAHVIQGADYATWCFGGADGFTTGFGMTDYGFGDMGDYGNSCTDDPFGGFWDEGGGGYGDGGDFGGGGGFLPLGETREECIRRHIKACDIVFYGCLGVAVMGGIGVGATCTITTFLLGLPVCVLLSFGTGIAGTALCLANGIACKLNAVDGCPP